MDSIAVEGQDRYVDGWRVTVDRFPNGAVEAFARPSWFERSAPAELPPSRRRKAATKADGAEGKQVDLERAARRAKKRIRALCLALGCDHMLTLTYRENMVDRERAKADWKRFVRLVQSRYPQWAYVVVIEAQERGALHFHAAVVGWQAVKFLRRCWHAVVGQDMGNIHVRGPKRRWGVGGAEWHSGKLASYISKYLGKNVDSCESWAKRYWATRLETDTRPVREVFFIQAMDGHMLIEEVYELVVGKRAVGVRQFLLPGDDVRYWVQAPPLTV